MARRRSRTQYKGAVKFSDYGRAYRRIAKSLTLKHKSSAAERQCELRDNINTAIAGGFGHLRLKTHALKKSCNQFFEFDPAQSIQVLGISLYFAS